MKCYSQNLCRCSVTADHNLFYLNQVKDADRVQTLGSLTIPLPRLLANANLSLDQWFQLENSDTASRIYVNTVLRVGASLS